MEIMFNLKTKVKWKDIKKSTALQLVVKIK